MVEMPAELKARWANIPTTEGVVGIWDYLGPIRSWLEDRFHELVDGPAVVLIQGEFVATYNMVAWLGNFGRVLPIAAVSRRDVIETTEPDGSVVKKTIFRHERWRAYFHRRLAGWEDAL